MTANRGDMSDPRTMEVPTGPPRTESKDESPAELRGRARIEPPDLAEKGGLKGGQPQRSDERLFMQLLAFTGCTDVPAAAAHLKAAAVPGVLYEDLNDPQGIAVL